MERIGYKHNNGSQPIFTHILLIPDSALLIQDKNWISIEISNPTVDHNFLALVLWILNKSENINFTTQLVHVLCFHTFIIKTRHTIFILMDAHALIDAYCPSSLNFGHTKIGAIDDFCINNAWL